MSACTKSLSARYTAAGYGVTEKTARLFMQKVRQAIKSCGKNPRNGTIDMDEFVLIGVDKVKIGSSYNVKN